MTELSTGVVQEDHKLERGVERSREALAKHRWHWTLDESNPRRVTVSEYARVVGRDRTTIRDMVHGYEQWSRGGAPPGELANFLEQAKLRGDDVAATEAYAEANDITLGTARRHHRREIDELKYTATMQSQRSGTRFADEAQSIAQTQKKAKDRDTAYREAQRKNHTRSFIAVDGNIAGAERYLKQALSDAEGVAFDDDERELLQKSLANLRTLLDLVNMRVGGAPGVDWDAELEKLT